MASSGNLQPSTGSPDPGDALDFRVRRRDRYSIEVKYRHLLDPDRDRYSVRRTTRSRLVFFLPYSFNIRSETYDPADLMRDTKLYVRFNTPRMAVDELLDPDSADSPLARIVRMLDGGPTVDRRALRYEAKLLGAVLKSALRDAVVERVAHGSVPTQEEIDAFADLCARIDRGLARFRDGIDRAPDVVREPHLRLVDEHLSLTIENYLVRLLTHEGVAGRGLSTAALEAAIRNQTGYRRGRGYRSVVDRERSTARREEYIYRYKVLKHYAASVLFFEIHRGNQARRVEHLLYAVAAGIAMAIATGISFIGQIRFGTLSTTLFLVLVGAYMIKDRIKDAFRSVFQRTLGQLFYDTRTVFKDQTTHRAMGVVKERSVFLRGGRLDTGLLSARARGGFEQSIKETSPETTLEYTKLLRVNERRLHRTHRRITGLADINIIDVERLVRYLVRQREQVPVVDDEVRLVETKRIYHLNMLICPDADRDASWHKIRLIVDAGGIRRIEREDAS